jgi:hypothetical protein
VRNYISTRGMVWEIPYFDDTHVQMGQVQGFGLGENDVGLKTDIETNNAAFLSSLPANWTIEPYYPNPAITLYFLLDKAALFFSFYNFRATYLLDAITNTPPLFPILANPKKSPRSTGWTDPNGVKRTPPPSEKKEPPSDGDFSGAQGLLDAISALPTLAAKLTQAGELRQAGIVIYAYEQVVRQNWTVTQAFDYLLKNRIVSA